MKRTKVSLIIPAMNERENIYPLFDHIYRFLFSKNLLEEWEVVIVDDGSQDGTYEEIMEVKKKFPDMKVKVRRHQMNLGVTAALETGAEVSDGEILVFFPADLQFRIEDVKKLIDKMEEGYDLVTGKKKGKYEKAFVSRVYNTLSKLLFQIPVSDMNSIKAFRREIIENIPLRKDWHRYIVPLAYYRGYSLAEVEVNLYPREHGRSKFTGFKRVIIGFFDLIAVKFQLSFMRKPMLFFGTIGGVSTLLGTLIGLFAIYLRVFKHHGYRPLIYLTMFLVISGLILFTIGLMGEMIVGLYDLIEKKCRD